MSSRGFWLVRWDGRVVGWTTFDGAKDLRDRLLRLGFSPTVTWTNDEAVIRRLGVQP